MAATTSRNSKSLKSRLKKCGIDCTIYTNTTIRTLSDFFGVFHSLLAPNTLFWFRGHSRLEFKLAPSALRYENLDDRNRALSLVSEMRRFLEMKLPRPPKADDHLAWLQVAQHYGLPTRLLDWTQNAAVALFFACCNDLDADGLVATLDPIELNQKIPPGLQRILNPQTDAPIILPYLELDGRIRKNGRKTVAINPTWNTERIALQQGVFTLHGSRHLELDRRHAKSLVCVPILKEYKDALLNELHRVGIGEMFIFPEPEHVCIHLRRLAKL